MIENLGPHWVQLMNGYLYLRSLGSRISPRQASHVARSGVIPAALAPPKEEERISKQEYPASSRDS